MGNNGYPVKLIMNHSKIFQFLVFLFYFMIYLNLFFSFFLFLFKIFFSEMHPTSSEETVSTRVGEENEGTIIVGADKNKMPTYNST